MMIQNLKFVLSLLLAYSALLEAQYLFVYKGPNHSEFLQEISLYDNVCQNVKDGEVVRSLDTVGHCAVLYSKFDCKGQKLRLYSPDFVYNNLNDSDFGTKVLSIGRCKKSVDLYDDEDFTVYDERVVLIGSEDCVGIKSRWATKPIKSVDVRGGCLYVHDGENCDGHKLQLKSGRRSEENFSRWPYRTKIQSISPCHDYETYRRNQDEELPPSVLDNGPIFGQYVNKMSASVIKVGSVPPHDHFCELTRRCSQNRNFDCDALKNENRCYCHKSGSVTCDSGQFEELNSERRKKNKQNGFPIAGQYDQENGYVYLISSSYESPFVQFCQLVKLCERKRNDDECGYEDKRGGGRGLQSYCDLSQRYTLHVLPASAGIKVRRPPPVEEEEEEDSDE